MERKYKIIYWLNFFSEFKLYGVIAVLFYIQITNSMMLGMSIFSISTLVSCIAEIPTGIISDKVGRRKTIIFGSIFSTLSLFFMAIANNYIVLIVSAVLNGIELAFYSGNNEAYIYELLKQDEKENEYNNYAGKINSMKYLAGAVSAAIGCIIVYFTSYRTIILLSFIPKAFLLFNSFRLKEINNIVDSNDNIKNQIKKSTKLVIHNKILRKQIIADGINEGIGEACFQFRSAFYELVWAKWALGIPGILSNMGATIANWNNSTIINKLGKRRAYCFINIYSILTNIIGVVVKSFISPIIMISNSLFTTEIIQMEVEQKLYDDKYRASMGSVKSLFKNVIFSIVSLLIGFFADRIGIIASFVIFQMFKIIPIYIYTNILKQAAETVKLDKI